MFKTYEELRRYYQDKFDKETEGMTLEEKLERAVTSRYHTWWWYGQRWERLRELFKGTDLEERACCVMANGTADIMEHPTMNQQHATLEHDLMKARLALRNCLAMASRVRRAQEKGLPEDVVAAMEHIERFCAEAGIKPTILREDDSLPPV